MNIIEQTLLMSQEERDNFFINNIYTVDTFKTNINSLITELPTVKKRQGKKTYEYINLACAFDIETTSFYRSTGTIKPQKLKSKSDKDNTKSAFMYVWQCMINGIIIMGRTWSEFSDLIDTLSETFKLDKRRRLVIYVHNLAYEFQFMRRYFKIKDLFATDKRTPIRFHIKGVEFRDSLILSGYALRNLHKELAHKIDKRDGDLDYKLIRHKDTPLTDLEKLYCIYDVYIVSVFIWEKLERGEDLAKIPFTKTGYVRHDIYEHTTEIDEQYKYGIRKLTLEPAEYERLRATYQGGFTHANTLYADDTLEDVTSKDFTSSYPTVLIAEKFPMSKGKLAILSNSQKYDDRAISLMKSLEDKGYGFMCQIALTDVKPKVSQDEYISESKCEVLENSIVENGRVSSADVIVTNITDVDFQIIEKVYTWETLEIAQMWVYKMEYLPTSLVKRILQYYIDKTQLKDVPGKEIEYGIAKGLLNAIYGMMCQNPLQPINLYEDEWREEEVDIEEGIATYNKSKKRTTFYPWGVWCCAYARRNLWLGGILPLGDDYIYSDTDSVKYLNAAAHEEHFKQYNKDIIAKLEKAMEHHGLPKDSIRPKTMEGVEKPLGVWDDDGHYKRFKTVGAKRYLVEKDDGTIVQTIAGLPKDAGIEFFNACENPFEIFKAGDKDDALVIPADKTGKNILTYIDNDTSGTVTDYKGQTASYSSLSCIHMEETAFSMSLSDEFLEAIFNKKTLYI